MLPVRRPARSAPTWGAAGVVAAAVLVAGALTGCTNQEVARTAAPVSGTATALAGAGGVQRVTLDVGDDYRFHPATVVVSPGRARITLHHTGEGAPHNWQLTGHPADFVPFVNPGETRSATFMTPSPGSYRFVCTIHVEQGQVGTLVVRPGGSP